MNTIDFKIIKIDEAIVDGIPLKDCLLVELLLDSKESSKIDFFEDSYLIVEQLFLTGAKSGDFFLFSGISGILEEEGWEFPTQVLHKDSLMHWRVRRGGQVMSLAFDKENYEERIERLRKQIANLNLRIEPTKIFFK